MGSELDLGQKSVKSMAQRVAHYYGMDNLPRKSVTLPGGLPNIVVIAARHDDRVRLVVSRQWGSGEHLNLTVRQARQVRDAIDHALGADV